MLKPVKTTHPDFEFTVPRNANFAIQRVGARAGQVHRDLTASQSSHDFIRGDVEAVMTELDFVSVASNASGPPSLAKCEIVSLYRARMDKISQPVDGRQMGDHRVVGYVRVSTEDQAEHRTSIDSQIEMIRADAEAKGQELIAVFSEPGVSGREEAHPEFNRMLAFVKDADNRVAEIKIVSLSRLARNLLAMFDEHFAHEAAKHTKRTMRANAVEGFFNGGPVPFGYESRTVERRGNKEE